MRFLFAFTALLALGAIQPVAALAGGSPRTELLATVSAGPDFMPHEIPVVKCSLHIDMIKIRVLDNSVYMQDIMVVFADKTQKPINMNRLFDVGYQSPWIPLGVFRPAGSCVTKLVVNGNAGDDRLNARVEVFGVVKD